MERQFSGLKLWIQLLLGASKITRHLYYFAKQTPLHFIYFLAMRGLNTTLQTSTLDGWTATQLGLVITEVSKSRAESSFSWGLNSFTTGIESVVRHSQSGFNYWCEIVNEWEKKTVWEGLLCFCCWLLDCVFICCSWVGGVEQSESQRRIKYINPYCRQSW